MGIRKPIGGKIWGWLAAALLFAGCFTGGESPPLKISANAWIGYTPLFYAEEEGWLRESGFSLKFVSSLSESLNLFTTRSVDVMASTQYEYFEARAVFPDTVPFLLLDRSAGGDMILSNRTLQTLLESNATVDVYLEQESINTVLLKDFAHRYRIPLSRFRFVETNPEEYARLRFDPGRPAIAVTYAPYHRPLLERGFGVLASTASLDTLLVIDALFADSMTLRSERERFERLKRVLLRAVDACRNEPRKVYEKVRPYFGGSTYEEFSKELASIVWIARPRADLLEALSRHGIETGALRP